MTPARDLHRMTAETVNVAAVPRLSLDIQEACAAIGVSWDTWHQHIEPNVRIVRVGKRKIVPVTEIQRWLSENAETTLERRP